MADVDFDVEKAKVYQTGLAFINRSPSATLLSESEMKAMVGSDGKITPPTGYESLGLWAKDSGPEFAREAGDSTEFYQPGFELVGEVSRTVGLTLAEDREIVQWLDHGKTPGAEGAVTVGGANGERFPLLLIMKRRDGLIDATNGFARVQEFAPGSAERGTLETSVSTFKWSAADELGGDLYRRVPIVPAVPTPPAG
ncbi:hypothetical protein [Gulosibacter molinativorax]|uniref:Phage tail protein n=1 Tax=Gulosibacter molinativorax TaxID=256821 RepID=A0ABT7CC79_9MICO|nr:hypothetical protein [Gulosibacter molinativorax]MDJ1372750.1 hypothetical protein [Gulosibacter molinativorax]QUY60896.1 Hypotetical protein [Gulosibacter molinativorax]